MNRPEWLSDSRFDTARNRAINARELIAALDVIFATKTLDEWTPIFEAEPELFWSPVNGMEDILGDEQFHAGGGWSTCPTVTRRCR